MGLDSKIRYMLEHTAGIGLIGVGAFTVDYMEGLQRVERIPNSPALLYTAALGAVCIGSYIVAYSNGYRHGRDNKKVK